MNNKYIFIYPFTNGNSKYVENKLKELKKKYKDKLQVKGE